MLKVLGSSPTPHKLGTAVPTGNLGTHEVKQRDPEFKVNIPDYTVKSQPGLQGTLPPKQEGVGKRGLVSKGSNS